MSISDAELIEVAQRAMESATHTAHLEMKRGLAGLATIASTAPFIGLFGTVLGLMHAFRGYIGAANEIFLAVTTGVEQALLTTAVGLLVAVPAVWAYNYFTDRVEGFRIEMEMSALELATYLLIHLRSRKLG
jgi:biopolymer transport protein ExbB/TolQ